MATCDSGNASCRDVINNGLTRRTVIHIVIACAALFLFLVICGLCLRRRRIRESAMRLPRFSYRSPNPPKRSSVPIPASGYPGHYQPPPPPPPPSHIPQYPPRGHDAYLGNSRSQRPSSVRRMPEPVTPVSPVSQRAPSSITSRPISSVGTAPISVRGSEPPVTVPLPPSPTLSSSPRSPQRNVARSSLPPTSSPRQSTASVTDRPSASVATRPSNTSRPPALSPMHTGLSTAVADDPPPAYTPL